MPKEPKMVDVWHCPAPSPLGRILGHYILSHREHIPSWLSYSQHHPRPASPPLPEVDNLSSTNHQLLVLTTLQPMHIFISLFL